LGRNGSNRLILTLRHSLGDSAACSADTHGSLPDTPCSAPCYSCGQSIRQHTELFGVCRPERGENRAQIANLPVFLPVTRGAASPETGFVGTARPATAIVRPGPDQ